MASRSEFPCINSVISRRGVLAGAAALTATGLTGCTVGGSSNSHEGSASSKSKLKIVMWTNPAAIDYVKKLNATFEQQHPGVKVQLQDAPTANNAWGTLTNSALASKSVDLLAQYQANFPPSYTGIKPSGVAALVKAGQLADLRTQPFMKNYDAARQQGAMGYQGGVYGVLTAAYAWAGSLWCKTDLLAKYNLTLPTTFGEFVTALKKFKSNGMTAIFVAAKDSMQGDVFQGIYNQLIMQGHPSADATAVSTRRVDAFWHGTQGWNDPVYHEAAQRYAQVMEYVEPAATGVAQLTAPGVWAAKNDDYPFLVDGGWDGGAIAKANPSLKFQAYTLPGTDSAAANRLSTNNDLVWTVPKWAPNKSLAMEWLKLFSEPDNYKKWLSATGSVSLQPGMTTLPLPWQKWSQEHASTAFVMLHDPWMPNGAPPEASGPVLSKMVPFGKQSINDALATSAKAYRKSVGK